MRRRNLFERPVALSDATIGKDFYTFHDKAGVRDVSIETWFAEDVEGLAADILRSARAGTPPAEAQVPVLALYIAGMLMRTKLVRQRFDEIDAHTGPLMALTTILADQHIEYFTLSPQEQMQLQRVASEFWDSHGSERDPRDRRLTHLRTMLREIDQLAQKLETWHYVLDDVRENVLITSDSAVAVIEPVPAPGWRGIVPAGSWIAVPVNPRHVIIGTAGPIVPGAPATGAPLADLINKHVAGAAYDAIFKHPDSLWPAMPAMTPTAQPLPTPTRTLRPSEPGSTPTFPAEYPKVRNPRIRELLTALGAVGSVE